jgi:hypothetical protein
LAEELIASALRSIAAGTMVGTNDCDAGIWKARVTPRIASTPKIGSVVPIFNRAKLSSNKAHAT